MRGWLDTTVTSWLCVGEADRRHPPTLNEPGTGTSAAQRRAEAVGPRPLPPPRRTGSRIPGAGDSSGGPVCPDRADKLVSISPALTGGGHAVRRAGVEGPLRAGVGSGAVGMAAPPTSQPGQSSRGGRQAIKPQIWITAAPCVRPV